MARLVIEYTAQSDLERLVEFLREKDPAAAGEITRVVLDGLSVLERHPMIGRPVDEGLRELVISRGRTGYVALYNYQEVEDLVLVLGLRHQREAGFQDPS